MNDRARAVSALEPAFGRLSVDLGLGGEASVGYRPRSRAGDPAELASELTERIDSDLERGFTGHGPHRDELAIIRAGTRAAYLWITGTAAPGPVGAVARRTRDARRGTQLTAPDVA